MPTYSLGNDHYNLRNPCRQIPRIKHEFPKFSLRYKIITTLNESSSNIVDSATTLNIKNYTCLVKNDIINKYKYTCNVNNCFVCK